MFEIGAFPVRRPHNKYWVIVLAQNVLVVVEVMLQSLVAIIQPTVNEHQQVGLAALLEAGLDRLREIIGDCSLVCDQIVSCVRTEIVEQAIRV